MILQSKAYLNCNHPEHWKLKGKIQKLFKHFQMIIKEYSVWGVKNPTNREHFAKLAEFKYGGFLHWKSTILSSKGINRFVSHAFLMISSKYLFPELQLLLVYTVYKSMIFHHWLTQQEDNLPQGTSSSSYWHFIKFKTKHLRPRIREILLVTSHFTGK